VDVFMSLIACKRHQSIKGQKLVVNHNKSSQTRQA